MKNNQGRRHGCLIKGRHVHLSEVLFVCPVSSLYVPPAAPAAFFDSSLGIDWHAVAVLAPSGRIPDAHVLHTSPCDVQYYYCIRSCPLSSHAWICPNLGTNRRRFGRDLTGYNSCIVYD